MSVKQRKGAAGRADRLWSQIIRSRGICERCGTVDSFQAAHIIPRRYAKTRTVLDNGWCLCGTCHFEVDNFADEKMALVERTIGSERYWELRELAQDTRGKVDWPREARRLKAIADGLAA